MCTVVSSCTSASTAGGNVNDKDDGDEARDAGCKDEVDGDGDDARDVDSDTRER